MTATSIAVFSALEEYEAALQQGGTVELLLTAGGEFQAKLTRIALPRLCLLRGQEWLARIALVSVDSDSLLVAFPSEPGPSQTWGGAAVKGGEIMTVGPTERLHVQTSQRCRWGVISVSVRAFERYGHAVLGSGFTSPAGIRRWQPPPADLQSLMGLFNSAIRLMEAQPGRAITAAAAHGLEQEVIQALMDCLRAGPLPMGDLARHRHIAIMRRLDDILTTRSGRTPRVAELCSALGISQRPLFTCCKEQVGISPSLYFRLRRMRRVHRALIGSHPGSTRVSVVATSHGFRDLGRFAGDYRKLFGELPSTTLRNGPGASRRPRTS
jgi:AraC-like DNA-binding protein